LFPCYCASTGTQGAEERRGKLKHAEFYRTEMRGKSQAGIILRADGVGKMCKEDEMWINLKMLSRMLGEFTLI